MADARRTRGRPREFDEDAVLDAVLGVFWTRGFAGASLEELAAAAGVTRPSLYTALGDKKSMYLRSLERFVANLDVQLDRSFTGRPLVDGLSDFYNASLDLYVSGDTPLGCLVMCTAPAEAVSDIEVRSALGRILSHLDNAFESRFNDALGRAGSSMNPPSADRGKLASAALQSLALRARAGQPEAELRRFIESTSSLLAAQGGVT